jgi:hypothetical protein
VGKEKHSVLDLSSEAVEAIRGLLRYSFGDLREPKFKGLTTTEKEIVVSQKTMDEITEWSMEREELGND